MRLSQDLMSAGILSRPKTHVLTDWEYETPSRPKTNISSALGNISRRRESIRVSPKGWRVLSNILRFH